MIRYQRKWLLWQLLNHHKKNPAFKDVKKIGVMRVKSGGIYSKKE